MKARLLLLSAALMGAAFAHEGHEGKPVTLTGTVVDTGCHMSHDGCTW